MQCSNGDGIVIPDHARKKKSTKYAVSSMRIFRVPMSVADMVFELSAGFIPLKSDAFHWIITKNEYKKRILCRRVTSWPIYKTLHMKHAAHSIPLFILFHRRGLDETLKFHFSPVWESIWLYVIWSYTHILTHNCQWKIYIHIYIYPGNTFESSTSSAAMNFLFTWVFFFFLFCFRRTIYLKHLRRFFSLFSFFCVCLCFCCCCCCSNNQLPWLLALKIDIKRKEEWKMGAL